jgi:hypothetical protein
MLKAASQPRTPRFASGWVHPTLCRCRLPRSCCLPAREAVIITNTADTIRPKLALPAQWNACVWRNPAPVAATRAVWLFADARATFADGNLLGSASGRRRGSRRAGNGRRRGPPYDPWVQNSGRGAGVDRRGFARKRPKATWRRALTYQRPKRRQLCPALIRADAQPRWGSSVRLEAWLVR